MAKIVLFTAPSCSVCQNMKNLLAIMADKRLISLPEIIDITFNSDKVELYDFQSVPWLKIDHLFFHGNMQQSEIINWITKFEDDENVVNDYFVWQLRHGQLPAAEMTLKHHNQYISNIVFMLLSNDSLLTTRIGLMALLESFEGSKTLHDLYPLIHSYIEHEDFRIRADLCQLLEMTAHPKAVVDLLHLSQDQNKDVRESATDALIELGELDEQGTFVLH